MSIRIQCSNPECKAVLELPDDSAGKQFSCSQCGINLSVPKQEKMLGDFRLVRKIGQGAMGVVYESIQVKLDRRVALKVLPQKFTQNPAYLERFQREAKAAAALNHSSIIQVYDIGEDDGHHFFAMEFVDGESVQDVLKRDTKIPLAKALEIVEGVAKALRVAHRETIIHRDIKPDNIMLTKDGEVKLADLGLAKKVEGDSTVTQTGTGLGTPYYMAPEQAEDARSVDHRADIYALGITLFHLLTGRPPFTGDSPYSIILAHSNKPLPKGKDLDTPLPEPVESLIQKMCAKKPEERYQDYDSLIKAIDRIQSGRTPVEDVSVVQSQPTMPLIQKRKAKKNRNKVFSLAALAIFISAVTFALMRMGSKKSETKKTAVTGKKPVVIGKKPVVITRQPGLTRKKSVENESVKTSTTDVPKTKIVSPGREVPEKASIIPAAGTMTVTNTLDAFFDIPSETKDQHGNPIRKGADEKAGWPLEIRHKETGMHLVLIRPSEFMMGSPDNEEGRVRHEGPVHRVHISKPFFLGKYEVTQAEWQTVMGKNPSKFKGNDLPVENVSWEDAVEFCKKLSAKEKKTYRLPTEAEWEYACRAGTKTAYSFGNSEKDMDDYAWYKTNGKLKTHPVGQKKPNAWGLYDMHGNVWDWCSDWYGNYPTGTATDPPGPKAGKVRVMRGGGWLSPLPFCRSAVRYWRIPSYRLTYYGFRVALHLPENLPANTQTSKRSDMRTTSLERTGSPRKQESTESRVSPARRQPVATKDAVLYYTFDESTIYRKAGETYVRDLSGNGYDAHILNGVKLANGKFGRALKFFGRDGHYVDIGDVLNRVRLPLSISMWAYIPRPDRKMIVFSSDRMDQKLYAGFVIMVGKNEWWAQWGNGRGGGGPSFRRSCQALLKTDEWVHLVAVMNADRSFRMYLNGKGLQATPGGNARKMRHTKIYRNTRPHGGVYSKPQGYY